MPASALSVHLRHLRPHSPKRLAERALRRARPCKYHKNGRRAVAPARLVIRPRPLAEPAGRPWRSGLMEIRQK
eukprot:6182860-Pleurochrysis_carterae.AAC.3